MKTLSFSFALVLLICPTVNADSAAGPRGGKLLQNDPPRAEVLIRPDRVISIAFYDAAGKPVPPDAQVATVIAETAQGKATLPLERAGEVLISKAPLPEGTGYNIVIQLKQAPDAKPQNFRVKYNTSICGECGHPEYACTCDH